jgi:dethiobiotin synthetase
MAKNVNMLFTRSLSSRNSSTISSSNLQRPIFVAATKQHVGKTSSSLALLSGLQKRFDKVGFIKPVGQQHVPVHSSLLDKTIRVDKDVCLMKEHFNLSHLDYEHMSPVIIPQGYTKEYINGKIDHDDQLQKVLSSFKYVQDKSDVVLMEGTGHCAVGSVVGVNNAQVANMIGADMVLIANGGLGSTFDELELNRVLCQHYNVRIAGVIINKVLPSKYDQIKHYMSKALMDRWGVPLLGVVPDRPFLGCPALMDMESIFKTELITGQDKRFCHYNVSDINLVTTSLTRFLENLRDKPTRTMYVCHITRDDLILGFMAEYQRRKAKGETFEASLIVCGRKEKYQMIPEIRDMIVGLDGAPVSKFTFKYFC